MKSNRSYCEDLNKQLAMYLAFRNAHGAAAVMRQLQGSACPIESWVPIDTRMPRVHTQFMALSEDLTHKTKTMAPFLNQVKTKFKFWTQTIKVYSLTFMPKIKYRLVETPMGSTIDSLCEGGYLVCDRDHNCREVLKLWEADDCLREQEIGFDYPYATNFRPTHWLPTTHLPPQWSTAFEVDSWQVLHDHRHTSFHRQEQGLTILYRNRRWMVNWQGNVE